MFPQSDIDGTEIEFALEERALDEIDSLHVDFLEWLKGNAEELAQIVGRNMRGQITDSVSRMARLKKDYIDYRKYLCDPNEWEEIADELRQPDWGHDEF
jgi:hypothetical protein